MHCRLPLKSEEYVAPILASEQQAEREQQRRDAAGQLAMSLMVVLGVAVGASLYWTLSGSGPDLQGLWSQWTSSGPGAVGH